MSIAAALVAARDDQELRFAEFIEKLSLQDMTSKRPREDDWDSNKASKAAKNAAKKKKTAQKPVQKGAGRNGGGPKGGKGKDQKGKGGKGNGAKNQKGGNGRTFEGVWIPAAIRLKPKTGAGKLICYGYGSGSCTALNCDKEHVCQICEANHGWKTCPRLH